MVVTERFVYLATPRTASRSIEQAVLASEERVLYKSKKHHAGAREVAEILRKHRGKPVYTVVRDPVRQALSWYYHCKASQHTTFIEFIKNYTNGWLFGGKLNIYLDVPDANITFVPLHQGANKVLEHMGLPNTESPHIGRTPASERACLPQEEEAVYLRFGRFDFPLYELAKDGPIEINTTEFTSSR